MTKGNGHQPERPSWNCDTCGKPWPCAPAREHLTAEGGGTPLAVLMWIYLDQALTELPEEAIPGIFDRFVGWTRPIPLD